MVVFVQKIVQIPQAKSANGSLFHQKTVCSLSPSSVYKWQSLPVEDSLFPQQSANGSLFQQKTICSLSHSRVYKWQSLPVEDSLFPPSDWQMAVFSQEKTVCLLNTQRDRQMAVSSNSLSVSGMFSSPQSR